MLWNQKVAKAMEPFHQHCNRKDSWRWQTSNSEYGKFYVSIHREIRKSQEVHKDCSRTCENLNEDLKLAKARLEKLKITCGQSLCNSDGADGMTCTGLPTSPKLGNCKCPDKPGPPNKDMYITEMMNQFNGAKRHDPQMLMDHIKDEHPHLVKHIPPKLPIASSSKSCKTWGDHGQDDIAGACVGKLNCGLGAKGTAHSEPRGGPEQCREGAGKRKMSPRTARTPAKRQKGNDIPCEASSSELKHTAAGGANLPRTQRYNFYRYFGFAGQGAKTSRNWQSVKTAWAPNPP